MNTPDTSLAKTTNGEIKKLAKHLLVLSLKSYMAKTLHAFEQYALKNFKVRLNISIKDGSPECFEEISQERKIKTQAYILTDGGSLPHASEIPVVGVKIKIHREASDTLVKFIILHELWHLHMELKYNAEMSEKKGEWTWGQRPTGSDPEAARKEERDCNHFAALLSYYLDQLYTCENLRHQFKQFYTGPRTNYAPDNDILDHIRKNLSHFIISGSNFIRPVDFEDLVEKGLKEELSYMEKNIDNENDTDFQKENYETGTQKNDGDIHTNIKGEDENSI